MGKINLTHRRTCAAVRPGRQASRRGDSIRERRHGVAGFFLLCFLAIAPVSPAPAQENPPESAAVGQVVRQQGVVTALRSTVARPLHLGASVFQGDRIITAAEAKVEIAFNDGSTLTLGTQTSVDLETYSPASQRGGRLSLLIGIIRSSLSSLWRGGFEVHTRAAVASARSTEWITEVGEDRASVFVVSGQVAVTGTATGATVSLSEGDGTDVDVGGSPSPPTQWGAARVQDVLARTRLP